MLSRLAKPALVWGGIGLLMPLITVLVNYLWSHFHLSAASHHVFEEFVLLIWPTSLTMMATENATAWETTYLFLLAALANAIIYVLVGLPLQFLTQAAVRLLSRDKNHHSA
jgi:hypothetical protein